MTGGLLLLPATGQAAQTFGSRLINDPNIQNCEAFGKCTVVSFIHPSDPEGDPDATGAPSDGVITKFRIRAEIVNEPGEVTFRVADINRPDPNDEGTAVAAVTASGPTVTMQPNDGLPETPIQEFGGRLPVKKGQHLAIDTSVSVRASYDSSGSQFSYVFAPKLADGVGPQTSLEATGELLVAATIEPDADGDGFGDETQDQCPSQPTTQGACDNTAPNVTGLKVNGGKISYRLSEAATVSFRLEKKVPGRKVGKKCVRQTKQNKNRKRCKRFKKVGASFSGPGKAGANKATLPNGKKLRPGVYRLTMTVRDVAGNETTKTISFTVKKKKKKK